MPDYFNSIILIMALAVSLTIALEHYWSPAKLSPLMRYALGILAINLPATFAFIFLQVWSALLVLWIASGAAGLTTVLCYLVDHWRQVGARLAASENEGEILREAVNAQNERQL